MRANDRSERPRVHTPAVAAVLAASLLTAAILAGCCKREPDPEPIAGCVPESKSLLTVQHAQQQTSLWCWAAVAQMIMAFHGSNVSQCAQAQANLPDTVADTLDCCAQPIPAGCNQRGWPPFKEFGFDREIEEREPLAWDKIQQELYCEARPWASAYQNPGGGGHIVVVKGYEDDPEMARWLVVDNPSFASEIEPGYPALIEYEVYSRRESTSDRVWWKDYYQIRPAGAVPPRAEPVPPPPTPPQPPDGGERPAEDQPPAPGEPGRRPQDLTPLRAANLSLLYYAGSLSPRLIQTLGFTGAAELKAATAGIPFKVWFVRADELSGFQPGHDTDALLHDIHQLIFPVLAGNAVRALLKLEQRDGLWRPIGFGEGHVARRWHQARLQSAEVSHVPLKEYFAVTIPGVNAYFVAYRRDGQLMLASLYSSPELGLVAGSNVAARVVFSQLAPAAATVGGGLP